MMLHVRLYERVHMVTDDEKNDISYRKLKKN